MRRRSKRELRAIHAKASRRKYPRHFSSMVVVIEPKKYPDDPKKIAKEIDKKYNVKSIDWSGG